MRTVTLDDLLRLFVTNAGAPLRVISAEQSREQRTR